MSSSKKRSPRLGRGLSSLMASPVRVTASSAEASISPEAGGAVKDITEAEEKPRGKASASTRREHAGRGYDPAGESEPPTVDSHADGGLVFLPVSGLEPNRHQPRQRFDEAGLKRLADSIASEGIMQPIIARARADKPGRYEVVAGERRWRAAQIAGLDSVPVIVRALNDRQLAEWALIENLQREDLNPIERAEAFSRLIEQFGLSHEEAGARIGMDRSSISNHLRLLNLAEPVQQLIREGLLSMGQSRAIAGLSDAGQQQMLAERAVRQGLSVREVEAAVKKLGAGQPAAVPSGGKAKAAYLVDLEKQISEQLGTRVLIKTGRKKGAGTLSIEFYSLDQFDELVGKLGVKMS